MSEALKLTPKIVREKYFEVIGLLNKAFPRSVDSNGKFTDCHSRNAWILFGYNLHQTEPSCSISFWCKELKEFGNSSTGQHNAKNLKEAYDYLEGIKSKLLVKLEKKQEISSLFE